MEFEKIKEIISEQMNIAKDKITADTTFKDDLGADSLDVFQIITELEETFGMEFPADDADKIRTVGDAAEYIKQAMRK